MIAKESFLKQFNISNEEFENSKLEWKILQEIHAHYEKIRPTLQPTLNYVREYLGTVEQVHSIKARLKDPLHLIEKIIRKANKTADYSPTVDNYRQKTPDLVGVRTLHLFKSDWEAIHDSITGHWSLVETPEAKVREGDNPEFIRRFEDRGCTIKRTPAGYRSVHYVIELRLSRESVLVEIQVRTLFEEGWSEVDHKVRYPYGANSSVVERFLDVFNRLAGGADEMASFIMDLQDEISKRERDHASITAQLSNTVDKLKITSGEKTKLQDEINSLKSSIQLSTVTNSLLLLLTHGQSHGGKPRQTHQSPRFPATLKKPDNK